MILLFKAFVSICKTPFNETGDNLAASDSSGVYYFCILMTTLSVMERTIEVQAIKLRNQGECSFNAELLESLVF